QHRGFHEFEDNIIEARLGGENLLAQGAPAEADPRLQPGADLTGGRRRFGPVSPRVRGPRLRLHGTPLIELVIWKAAHPLTTAHVDVSHLRVESKSLLALGTVFTLKRTVEDGVAEVRPTVGIQAEDCVKFKGRAALRASQLHAFEHRHGAVSL